MSHIMRPLTQWPRWHRHCYRRAAFTHLFVSTSPLSSNRHPLLLPASSFSLSYSHVRFRSSALRLRDVPVPSELSESDSDSSIDANTKKSHNEKKREAKRAFKWGTEMANFSPPQIKRIVRVASLETEVYEAVLLAKRLGRDVREGKRRQFNYIGRLLRDVDPELMDSLIQATKDGDEIKFRNLSSSETLAIEDDNSDVEETDCESDEEITQHQTELATRWFDGLIDKDVQTMNEIYSLQHVDFDRQELRRLVRKVHSVHDNQIPLEEKGEQVVETLMGAKRSLNRFLRNLVKHLAVE